MCSPTALADRYLEVLNDRLGWHARRDDEGDIFFLLTDLPAEGDSVAWIDNHAPADPAYLRMGTELKLDVLGESTEFVVQLAAELTRELKAVKLHVSDGILTVAVEMLVAGPGCLPERHHLAAILPRARLMLVLGAEKFLEAAILSGIEAATRTAEEQESGER